MGCHSAKLARADEQETDAQINYILQRLSRHVNVKDIKVWKFIFKSVFGKTIPASYILNLYKDYFPERNNDDIYEEFLQRYTADSNGEIDFKAFFLALYYSAPKGNNMDEVDLSFVMYDIHADGRLSRDSFTQIALGFYTRKQHPELEQLAEMTTKDIFAALGRPEDTTLSLEEYRAAIGSPDTNNEDKEKFDTVHFLDFHDIALLAIANDLFNFSQSQCSAAPPQSASVVALHGSVASNYNAESRASMSGTVKECSSASGVTEELTE